MKASVLELESLDPNDRESFLAAVSRFYDAIGLMSGNRVVDLLASVLKQIHDDRVLRDLHIPPRRIPIIGASFRDIGVAILEGRAEDAESLMRSAMTYYVTRVLAKHPDILSEIVRWQDGPT